MDLDGDAVRHGAPSPFAAPTDGASSADPSHLVDSVQREGLSLTKRRHRARVWSLVCFVVGVPLMSYLAFGLAKVTIPANEVPEPWWIWFSVGVGALAACMVAAVFLGRWSLGRNLALVLMTPGLAMCLLLIWAFFFGLVFLPGALVWVPVIIVCQRMRADDREPTESQGAA
jgi:hypothetical protein